MKKTIPIIITLIIGAYFLTWVFLPLQVFKEPAPLVVKVAMFFMPLFAVGMILALFYTLKERLKEIDKEDKDDLSKY